MTRSLVFTLAGVCMYSTAKAENSSFFLHKEKKKIKTGNRKAVSRVEDDLCTMQNGV